jgi:hypothetical protein
MALRKKESCKTGARVPRSINGRSNRSEPNKASPLAHFSGKMETLFSTLLADGKLHFDHGNSVDSVSRRGRASYWELGDGELPVTLSSSLFLSCRTSVSWCYGDRNICVDFVMAMG